MKVHSSRSLFITASTPEQTTVLRLAGNKEGRPCQRGDFTLALFADDRSIWLLG
ncbi:hypothetical protein SynPROSU1_02283 [Synechococcus sp. PROS-U-1]|nr:hypothetical protein SynPROSU1_02283 [Synechococcus sp. PROS-U-1]